MFKLFAIIKNFCVFFAVIEIFLHYLRSSMFFCIVCNNRYFCNSWNDQDYIHTRYKIEIFGLAAIIKIFFFLNTKKVFMPSLKQKKSLISLHYMNLSKLKDWKKQPIDNQDNQDHPGWMLHRRCFRMGWDGMVIIVQHSTSLVQCRNVGQTSTWFCLARVEKYIEQLWQIHVKT